MKTVAASSSCCRHSGFLALLLAVVVDAASVPLASPAAANPVTKVVTLLEELKTRITQDSTEDQQVFDKYACWCEETTKAKANAITSARTSLTTIGHTILQLKGSVAMTVSAIQGLLVDIRQNEEAQESITNVRQAENAAFLAERSELQQATTALEQAIAVLKTSTGGGAAALLGVHRGAGVGVGAGLAAGRTAAAIRAVRSAASQLPPSAQPRAARHLAALDAVSGQTTGRRYAPQSATIQGILADMYETFTSSLESSTSDEAQKQRNYETLMGTYKSQLLTLQSTLTKKEAAKAEAETMLADATQDYASTEGQLEADVQVFDVTKASCVAKAQEWSLRKQHRTQELEGISKAIELLSSDEARQTFDLAIKPGFAALLQVDSSRTPGAVGRALVTLQSHARESRNLRLAMVVAAVREQQESGDVGHFDQVLQAIDMMVTTLEQEGAEDQKKADDCITKLHGITLKKEDLAWKIKKNDAKIDKLDNVVAAKTLERGEVSKEIKTVQDEISKATAARQAANQRFIDAKKEDEKAIQLLQQATTLLSAYYEQRGFAVGGKVSLLHAADAPNATLEATPEATFSGPGSRSLEAKGVVTMLKMIVEDLQAEMASDIKNEEADQLDYERRLDAFQTLEGELSKRLTDLDGVIALRSQEKADEETDKQDNGKELQTEEQTETDVKPDCDWLSANLVERRTKRAQEMDSLRVARQYLAGARPAAMLEKTAGSVSGSGGAVRQAELPRLARAASARSLRSHRGAPRP